jgi:hypothetical protein
MLRLMSIDPNDAVGLGTCISLTRFKVGVGHFPLHLLLIVEKIFGAVRGGLVSAPMLVIPRRRRPTGISSTIVSNVAPQRAFLFTLI